MPKPIPAEDLLSLKEQIVQTIAKNQMSDVIPMIVMMMVLGYVMKKMGPPEYEDPSYYLPVPDVLADDWQKDRVEIYTVVYDAFNWAYMLRNSELECLLMNVEKAVASLYANIKNTGRKPMVGTLRITCNAGDPPMMTGMVYCLTGRNIR